MKEISVLLPNNNCNYDSCSFHNVYQPPVDDDLFTVKTLIKFQIFK